MMHSILGGYTSLTTYALRFLRNSVGLNKGFDLQNMNLETNQDSHKENNTVFSGHD